MKLCDRSVIVTGGEVVLDLCVRKRLIYYLLNKQFM